MRVRPMKKAGNALKFDKSSSTIFYSNNQATRIAPSSYHSIANAHTPLLELYQYAVC